MEGIELRDVFTGASLRPEEHDGGFVLDAGRVLENFPVALLVSR
jgi:hypothetical protein